MKLTVYHLKACDTCRKAIKALLAAGHDLDLIDVRTDGVSSEDLSRFLEAAGRQKLLNTRSTTWRSLKESEKADLDDAKALGLLAKHPTLMKRPVIEGPGRLTVGWSKAEQDYYL